MDIRSDNLRVVVTGATGAIGGYLVKEFNANEYDPREIYVPGYDMPFCDVLINCIGSTYDKKFHKSDDLEWWGCLNQIGAISDSIKEALPYMRNQRFGRIINLSSVVPHLGTPGTSAYSAAKAGLWGLTKVLAKENADKNVLINCLNLGYMDGGMTHRIKNYEKIKETIPVKKFGDFKEIVNAIEFLVRSDYITGTNIEINGGLW